MNKEYTEIMYSAEDIINDMDQTNLTLLWSSLVLITIKAMNIREFVVSPGYRCAPLLYHLWQNKWANVYSQTDERAGAYLASGISKATNLPTVLICTSGTAPANYYPAVIEAFQDKTPLIILSADRPFELRDCDANQSIDQQSLFGKYVTKELNLPEPTEEVSPIQLVLKIKDLVAQSLHSRKPVHINIPLREPLDPKEKLISKNYLDKLAEVSDFLTFPVASTPALPFINIPEVILNLIKGNRTQMMVVVGKLDPDEDLDSIIAWLNSKNYLFYCDISSNIKYRMLKNKNHILDIEHPVVAKFLSNKKYPFGNILHLGGRLVSSSYYRILSDSPIKVIHVSREPNREDPSSSVIYKHLSKVDQFVSHFPSEEIIKKPDSDIVLPEQLGSLSKSADQWLNNLNILCHSTIVKTILQNLSSKEALYLGNSSVIRAFDKYCTQPNMKIPKKILCNRGVSGLEGFISSAKGYFLGSFQKVVLVLGDISFLYDINALCDPLVKSGLVIVIINNNKGGIFSGLPAKKYENYLSPLIETPHNLSFSNLLKGFPIKCDFCETIDQFKDLFKSALDFSGSKIIEARINPVDDEEITKSYNKIGNT